MPIRLAALAPGLFLLEKQEKNICRLTGLELIP